MQLLMTLIYTFPSQYSNVFDRVISENKNVKTDLFTVCNIIRELISSFIPILFGGILHSTTICNVILHYFNQTNPFHQMQEVSILGDVINDTIGNINYQTIHVLTNFHLACQSTLRKNLVVVPVNLQHFYFI
mmetsp:Transcript_20887/g.43017  ORF Transcript_20887/g.43017 Transcript_20887/m.43017 type:complete len:132 (+) Transcript_20887:45-440(+)